MEIVSERSNRKTRSDAERNRERLVAAAKQIFARGGAGASLEAVARAAELGIGTLYRHFPTREALYEAVYRRDIDQLVALGDDVLAALDPVAGLRAWLHAAIDMVATKKGMIAAFALTSGTTSAISARFAGRLGTVLGALLARGVEQGLLRPGITGEELLLAVVGMCMLRDEPGWPASVGRLVDALVDGLRCG